MFGVVIGWQSAGTLATNLIKRKRVLERRADGRWNDTITMMKNGAGAPCCRPVASNGTIPARDEKRLRVVSISRPIWWNGSDFD